MFHVINLKLDIRTSLTYCSQWRCSSMRDAVSNWCSVVMNIYAQMGLTVGIWYTRVSKQAGAFRVHSTFRTCFVKGSATIIGCWILTWIVLRRRMDGSSWRRTRVSPPVQERGKVTSRSRSATAISAAIGRTLRPITSLDVDSSTSSRSRTEHVPSTPSNAPRAWIIRPGPARPGPARPVCTHT